MTMIYPLKFEAESTEKIWGGRKIPDRFGKGRALANVGESWELYDRSVIRNGAHAGKTLADLLAAEGEAWAGRSVFRRFGISFPLLFKFIDASDKLSVQVHPDDAYANRMDEPYGKEEMWYIIDAPAGARLIYGLREGLDAASLRQAISDGAIAGALGEIAVKTGDFVMIPAGTVHALTEGLFIAEIQQNSDITFRLYDWDRTDAKGEGRTLHIDEALAVIDYTRHAPPLYRADSQQCGGAFIRRGPAVKGFETDYIELKGRLDSETDPESFGVMMILSGEGALVYEQGEVPLYTGDTVLLPAGLGEYSVRGQMSLLYTYCKEE